MRMALACIALSSSVAGPAFAQEAALARCRTITEPMARLACYDAIRPAADAIGLPTPEARGDTPSVTTTIKGEFLGWVPNGQITLANGQVWRVIDGSRGVYRLNNPKVEIKRGALGSFNLDIEGTFQSPKVRRVR
jgi:hypothetical protein